MRGSFVANTRVASHRSRLATRVQTPRAQTHSRAATWPRRRRRPPPQMMPRRRPRPRGRRVDAADPDAEPEAARDLHLDRRTAQERAGDRLVQGGVLNLFLRSTTAALSVNENADPDVRTDLENALDRVVRAPTSSTRPRAAPSSESPWTCPCRAASSPSARGRGSTCASGPTAPNRAKSSPPSSTHPTTFDAPATSPSSPAARMPPGPGRGGRRVQTPRDRTFRR